jgi:hypothetical protein
MPRISRILLALALIALSGTAAAQSGNYPVPSGWIDQPGAIIVGRDQNNLTGLAGVAVGQVLTSGGVGALPAWSAKTSRGAFDICGDATTINNNTIYYGPSIALTANILYGTACDITAAGNATEATADAPTLTNQAFQVTGMICRNQADQDAAISYTLRTAAGATVPSVTCTIADDERDCVADVVTTTDIAAGATVAIAAASAGDIGASKGFNCTVAIAY